MNIKDLNLEDLVLYTDKEGEIETLCKINSLNLNGEWSAQILGSKSIFQGDNNECSIEECLLPIPLTHEILKKNKDILYGELPILFDDGKMRYSIVECRYVSKEYEQNNETFYCLLSSCVYNGGSFITPFAKIQYVHELQHALRLCGIEKEIVL